MDDTEGYPDARKSINSRQQMSKNQHDSQGEVRDFFGKIMLWRNESQREFLNIVDTHSNIINEAMCSLVEEVSDLKAQLSVTRKERNKLIETVKNMSRKIQKQQPDNEELQNLDSREVGYLKNEETGIKRLLVGYEDEDIEHHGDISDVALNQQISNDEDTENYLNFNYFGDVDAIDIEFEGVSDNDISHKDHDKEEHFGCSDRIGSYRVSNS